MLSPIEKSDIFSVPKGTKVGDQVAEKNGFFLSDLYLEKVARARVER